MAIDLTIVSKDLDVTDKYNQLLDTLLCDTSIYIRTKETLAELVNSGDLKGVDKAKVIAEVLGTLNNSMVNASLQTALAWASKEKEVELNKLELGRKLAIMDQQELEAKEQVKNVRAEAKGKAAQARALYGTATYDENGNVTSLGTDGKTYQETQVLKQEVLSKAKEVEVMGSKLEESKAAIYKVVADTYAHYGNMSWSLTGAAATISAPGLDGVQALAQYQADIAKNQADGYVLNAWSNAVVSSATMVGTALASDSEVFTQEGQIGKEALDNVAFGLRKLLKLQKEHITSDAVVTD